jgi:glycosyltransferase involved in cell wall biosynthesis
MEKVTPSQPKLSVVLCTRNRAEALIRCLAYFVEVKASYDWDLIVVDNGSFDGTSAVLESELKSARLPLIVVKEESVGLSRARNAGIKHARGEIVCFTDDDCYPDDYFVDAWITVFTDPQIGYGGGRIELFDPEDAKVTIKTEECPKIFNPNSFISPGTLHGASMAFRRSVIDLVGLFDENLGAGTAFGSGEDSDYLQRASEMGFIGRYSPEPLVWHHHGRRASDIAKLNSAYDCGRGAFYACILARNPRVLLSAISSDFNSRSSFKGYLGQLYWRYKSRPADRIWNVSSSAIRYWLLQARRSRSRS